MTSPPSKGTYPYPNEPTWSRPEKAIARKVFDAALKRELQEVMREAKHMANEIKDPADMWALENYLTRRRKEIDSKYEFRPSRLTGVFGKLLYERRITEDELLALSEKKLKVIRSCAKVLAEDAA
jgi:hypothetical protein